MSDDALPILPFKESFHQFEWNCPLCHAFNYARFHGFAPPDGIGGLRLRIPECEVRDFRLRCFDVTCRHEITARVTVLCDGVEPPVFASELVEVPRA